MTEYLHDLTMLYLSKNVPSEVSTKDLARLYDETYDNLKEEFQLIRKEKRIKPVSF